MTFESRFKDWEGHFDSRVRSRRLGEAAQRAGLAALQWWAQNREKAKQTQALEGYIRARAGQAGVDPSAWLDPLVKSRNPGLVGELGTKTLEDTLSRGRAGSTWDKVVGAFGYPQLEHVEDPKLALDTAWRFMYTDALKNRGTKGSSSGGAFGKFYSDPEVSKWLSMMGLDPLAKGDYADWMQSYNVVARLQNGEPVKITDPLSGEVHEYTSPTDIDTLLSTGALKYDPRIVQAKIEEMRNRAAAVAKRIRETRDDRGLAILSYMVNDLAKIDPVGADMIRAEVYGTEGRGRGSGGGKDGASGGGAGGEKRSGSKPSPSVDGVNPYLEAVLGSPSQMNSPRPMTEAEPLYALGARGGANVPGPGMLDWLRDLFAGSPEEPVEPLSPGEPAAALMERFLPTGTSTTSAPSEGASAFQRLLEGVSPLGRREPAIQDMVKSLGKKRGKAKKGKR